MKNIKKKIIQCNKEEIKKWGRRAIKIICYTLYDKIDKNDQWNKSNWRRKSINKWDKIDKKRQDAISNVSIPAIACNIQSSTATDKTEISPPKGCKRGSS